MNKLTIHVPEGTAHLTLARELDAPPGAVFAAMTDPALIPLWWGPAQYTTEVVELDPQIGGRWRFVQRDDAGNAFGFRGVFHEVLPAERVIQTFEFEPMPGHVILETLVFEDLGGGRTRIHGTSSFQSVADRDGMVSSGMESGLAESYDRLDALLTGA